MKKKEGLVNIDNARSEGGYRDVINKINKGGYCPFCEKNFLINHPKKIDFKTKYWIVTENGWPYKGSKYHFLMVYRLKHLTHINELSKEAILDKFTIEKKICKKYNIKGGTVMMRFGTSEITGASVEHLHFHIIVADADSKDYKDNGGIVTKIG